MESRRLRGLRAAFRVKRLEPRPVIRSDPDPAEGRRAGFWARGGNVYYKNRFPQPLFDRFSSFLKNFFPVPRWIFSGRFGEAALLSMQDANFFHQKMFVVKTRVVFKYIGSGLDFQIKAHTSIKRIRGFPVFLTLCMLFRLNNLPLNPLN